MRQEGKDGKINLPWQQGLTKLWNISPDNLEACQHEVETSAQSRTVSDAIEKSILKIRWRTVTRK